MTDVAFVLGTRPEIIKLAPVVQACQRLEVEYAIVHTGQHYSDSLDSVFFDQLELPEPDYNLGVGSSSHGEQTGRMLIGVERALTELDPDVVLVQGDTNSVLAGSIAASKMDAELGHVEAGLRSFDRSMPEETNRVVADHVAGYLFAPTEQSKAYLLDEGISEHRITVTGNTVVDALLRNREIARRKSTVLADLGLVDDDFFVMTAHRQENVDDEARFRDLLAGVERAAEAHDATVVYPVHPRARDRLEAFDIDVPERIRTVEPLEYLDFLRLSAAADLVLTDSGGVQEEACILGVPCVTMRDNTERPETIDVGANRLASTDPGQIVAAATEMLLRSGDWENPFGDGDAAERILRTLPLETRSREVAR
ncbi:non-hydrolyzing UDP-N-acetylglucosamine 2-epimerase [Halobellus limi]|uniref:UDP-N-acetylglucosamine 2-epimerase (Non-hydrolysing) n=1 Tax=Halobellus limi TaxID=699433 RepID=A0A1H6BC84_9EURY|nr:UDP-N-acetylglucosamine 2-epimerase (non-hydrolyzing) [Halobellus limi]QCC49277.1 UDP-N-acetylglucosamine 2-epimerase (non-hydrolyzing) [Halobellus limi]SEG58453.1 UDP-N-acetylglucosamine 2-epimerase (non-hydrolysing) [Halobellus limi]